MKQALISCTVFLLYVIVACILLGPLTLHLSDGFPAAESGDPLLQSWVLQWNIHKLSTSLTQYFDANIFHPYPNTFAYHDHLFGLGLLGLPVYLLGRNPILTYNSLLLLSFVFSAYSMFLLCKDITQNSYAASLGGLIFGFLPYRFAHLDHLNLLSVYWLPLCFLFLTRYLVPRSESPRHALLTLPFFWLCYFLQALTSFNYLFLSAIALGAYGIILMLRQWYGGRAPRPERPWRDLFIFFAGACVVGLSLLPLALPYLQANRSMGFERSVQETQDLSARAKDYIVAPESNLLYGSVTRKWQSLTSPYPREQVLFPGMLTMLLAGIALLYGWSGTRNSACDSARFAFGGLLLVACLLSFGPFATIFGKTISLPYSWLYHALPGFKSMRVPARFGLLVAFSLSMLASIGVMELYRHLSHEKKGQHISQLLMTLLLGGIVLLESYSPLSALSSYPGTSKTLPEAYQWLGAQPAALRIVELPAESPKDHFEAMYYSSFHWHHMLNGRSAFIPKGIERIFAELRAFPSQQSIHLLQSLNIDYVLLHAQKLESPLSTLLPEGLTLKERFGDDWLIQVETFSKSIDDSAKERDVPLRAGIHLSPSLRPGERYTLGLELALNRALSFSPLPEESTSVQIDWNKDGRGLLQERHKIDFPILFDPNERHILPLHVTTAGEPGEYQVEIKFHSHSIAPQSFSKHLTLLPEFPDSRNPHTLQAEYLWSEIPEEWPQGQPIPIRILVKNSGDTLWKAYVDNRELPEGEVRLAVVDWYKLPTGGSLIGQRGMTELGARGVLFYDVPPGQKTLIETEIPTPDLPGEFLLELDMLSEHVAWFSPERTLTFKHTLRLK